MTYDIKTFETPNYNYQLFVGREHRPFKRLAIRSKNEGDDVVVNWSITNLIPPTCQLEHPAHQWPLMALGVRGLPIQIALELVETTKRTGFILRYREWEHDTAMIRVVLSIKPSSIQHLELGEDDCLAFVGTMAPLSERYSFETLAFCIRECARVNPGFNEEAITIVLEFLKKTFHLSPDEALDTLSSRELSVMGFIEFIVALYNGGDLLGAVGHLYYPSFD